MIFKLLCFLVTLTQASHDALRNPDDITSFQDGTFEGLITEVIYKDIATCIKFNLVLFWNGVDTVKYAFFDPYLAIESFGLMIHKSPIVYKECFRVVKDFEYLEAQFLLLPQYKNVQLWTNLLENAIFNYGDVL